MGNAHPFLIGLTGSIGMGKSETAKMFARLGIPVYDSDAAVHRIYDVGGSAVPEIERHFPGCVRDGRVDRVALSAKLAQTPEAFKLLETIVHPLVSVEQRRFLDEAVANRHELVVLDIPLLFESGADKRLDAIVVVSAPAELQRTRVLARPNMDAAKFEQILARQVPDVEKRARADFVIETDKGLDHAFEQVKQVVAKLRNRAAKRNLHA